MDARTVCWFSCGAASAVATKLVLGENPDAVVARCVIADEHEDNDRFARDCERWFGKQIVELRSTEYRDCADVWERTRYLHGPKGARCTTELKKKVRQAFSRDDDVQVFGFTSEEKDRAEEFPRRNPEVLHVRFPLIERNYSKTMCFLMVQEAGIELPMMYRLGYFNANCIGCVKGGAGYWNKIRRDFPERFEAMAAREERLGHTCLRREVGRDENGKRIMEPWPLRTLDPDAGDQSDLELPECGLFCGMNEGRAA